MRRGETHAHEEHGQRLRVEVVSQVHVVAILHGDGFGLLDEEVVADARNLQSGLEFHHLLI